MTRSLRFALLIAFLALIAAAAVQAQPGCKAAISADPSRQTITVETRFGAPAFEQHAKGEALLAVDGLPYTLEAGLPMVPVKTVRVALPLGARLTGVQVEEGPVEQMEGSVPLARSMVPYSLRWRRSAKGTPEAAPQIEGDRYPASRVRTSLQLLHGVPIVIVNVYPVLVPAGKGPLSVARQPRVTLSFGEDKAAPVGREPFAHELEQVRGLVDNPEVVATATKSAKENADGYDYLIVSSEPFISYSGPGSFKDLQEYLKGRDLRSRVVDVAAIQSSTEGKDLQDKLRNYIRAEYQRAGIRYVLLAADGDSRGSGAVIPARRFWSKIRAFNGSWTTLEENIPADLYYSCLDGDFDGNGNGKWGEPTDGTGSGDVDLLAEVVIGRMPMKTTTDLQNFVKKTLVAASRPAPQSVLLMGEELFASMNLYGDEYMNQLVGTSTDHGYQTTGYGPEWAVSRLYDRESTWGGSQALSTISSGNFSMVNHLGHSNQQYNMRMYNSSIRRFANARPFFFYTQGCFPGDFTSNDCFVELLVRHDKGAVAAVANTCYGLGPEDPDPSQTTTPGASQMLHRRFIATALASDTPSLGRANQLSKEAFLGLVSAQEMRWVFWDATYFGDPSLKLSY